MITKFHIAYRNLQRKKARTLLTFSGITLSAWVLVSLLGFNRGYEAALNRDVDNLGYQLMVMAKGCPYEAATMMLQGGTGFRYINETWLDTLRPPDGVRVVPLDEPQVTATVALVTSAAEPGSVLARALVATAHRAPISPD